MRAGVQCGGKSVTAVQKLINFPVARHLYLNGAGECVSVIQLVNSLVLYQDKLGKDKLLN